MRSSAFVVCSVMIAGGLVGGCSLGRVSDWNPFATKRVEPRKYDRRIRTARPRRTETRRRTRNNAYRPPQKEAWLGMGEQACIASGIVQQSPFVRTRSSLGGPVAACGAYKPYVVTAVDNGRIRLTKAATLRCPMVPALERWTRDIVAPAAVRHLGSPITKMRVISSYSCRYIRGRRKRRLSEHGRANAIDIAAFETADGRVISLKRKWKAWGGEGRFLRAVHKGACRYFTTVLGPNYNRAHHDHFHFDLARHGRSGTYRICK